MLDLEAIKARCEAATPGPWVNTGGRFPKINGGPIGGCDVATLFFADGADAAFIAHAREDVPALVAEVERLQKAVAAEREACAVVCEAEGRQHPGVCQVFANILATLIRDGDGVILSKRADP